MISQVSQTTCIRRWIFSGYDVIITARMPRRRDYSRAGLGTREDMTCLHISIAAAHTYPLPLSSSISARRNTQPPPIVNKNQPITKAPRPTRKIQHRPTHLLLSAKPPCRNEVRIVDALCTGVSAFDNCIGHLRWED